MFGTNCGDGEGDLGVILGGLFGYGGIREGGGVQRGWGGRGGLIGENVVGVERFMGGVGGGVLF